LQDKLDVHARAIVSHVQAAIAEYMSMRQTYDQAKAVSAELTNLGHAHLIPTEREPVQALALATGEVDPSGILMFNGSSLFDREPKPLEVIYPILAAIFHKGGQDSRIHEIKSEWERQRAARRRASQ
jgi:hypothetical protein